MSNESSSTATEMGACRCALASITRKQLVGLTGLGLSIFVMIHMAGNMFIFLSPQAYNEYGHAITANMFLYVIELGLLSVFLIHVFYATYLTWRNFKARPVKYAVRASGEKRTPWLQRTLFVQGLVILVFVILHLITFKYGPHYEVDYGHGPIRDLFKLMLEVFRQPEYVAWYVVAVLILGAHLTHGVASSFQTMGLNHPRYQCGIRWFGRVYALVVAFGFISQPLYIYCFYKG